MLSSGPIIVGIGASIPKLHATKVRDPQFHKFVKSEGHERSRSDHGHLIIFVWLCVDAIN